MIRRAWEVSDPLDLERTLRMVLPAAPSLRRLAADGAVYALWTEAGPASVEILRSGELLEATATGPGAEAALAAVPKTVGLDDDPAAFNPGSGLVRDLHRRSLGFRLGATKRVFDTILPVVLGQRVTTAEAKQNYEHLVRATGEAAPGDSGLLVPPRPEAVLALSSSELHTLGIEQTRGRVIREVAKRAGRLEEIVSFDREAALSRLLAVTGVGPWTAAQVMGAAWGDRDAIPTGDFHLPNVVSWALAGEPRGSDERMLELLEPYRPYRRRALLLVKMSGIHAPRYGPRSGQSVISRGGDY
jgi:3-methyladenine DNA glycosylase/8-oxoguanine DNA glycosylase